MDEQTKKSGKLLEVICSLRKIVNHPYLFFQYYCKTASEERNKIRFATDDEQSSIRRMVNLNDDTEFKFFKA